MHCFGVPGSGKSQIVRKLGEKFPFQVSTDNFKSYIKWHIQCYGTGCLVKKEFQMLAEELRRHSFITSHEAYKSLADELDLDHVGAGGMVQVLLNCDAPVLIIIEDPDEQSKSFLRDFCRQLEQHKATPRSYPFHVYITSQKISKVFSTEEIDEMAIYQPALVNGFTKEEAVEFLNEAANYTHFSHASVKVYERFSGMPLGLKAARGYCRRSRIEYEDYLKIISSNEAEVKEYESENMFKEYGESGAHVFQAIVMPFKPSDDLNCRNSLHWKVLSCLSYFHHDCIPRFLMERCCYILLDDPHQKTMPHLVKAYAGQLISELHEYGMCMESSNNDISIHEVILNAFRFHHHADKDAKLYYMKMSVEILCSLVSKDLRKKNFASKLFKLQPHIQRLLSHIEPVENIFEAEKDLLLIKVLLSHLCEVIAVIIYGKFPTLSKESEKYFRKALSLLWEESDKLIDSDTNISVEDQAKLIVEQSISKGLFLPPNFIVDYASKLYFCFEETEFEFLKSLNQTNFEAIEKVFRKHDSKKKLIKTFQKFGYFLSNEIYSKIFYADRLSSILHSWSRTVLFAEMGKVTDEKCLRTSTLSKDVAVQCSLTHGVHLLTEWLQTIGVLIPVWIKQKRNPDSLNKALSLCHSALSTTDQMRMYEYGMIKETSDHSRPFSRILILRNIVHAYTRANRLALDVDFAVGEKLCGELFQLVSDNALEYANSPNCLVYCAKYYASRGRFEKSMECFQKFFTLSSVGENKRRFKRYCWAVYNYARATLRQSNPPPGKREEAIKKVQLVLQTNEVMTDDMNKLLKDVLHELEFRLSLSTRS